MANGKCYGAVEELSNGPECPEGYHYNMDKDVCAKAHEEYLFCPAGYIIDPNSYHSCIMVTDPIE